MRSKIKYIILLLVLFLFPIVCNAKENKVTLYLFHGDGCPHCAEEIKFLNSIEKQYDNLEIVKYEVWYNDENAELLQNVKDAFEETRNGVPTTVIGDTMFLGYSESTGKKIERAIKYYSENEYIDQVSRIADGTFVKEELKNKDNDFEKEEKKSDEAETIKLPELVKLI